MTEKDRVWCVCRYTPVEIFTGGFGCGCEKTDPSYVSFDCADSCAHPNLCGYGKGVIEEVNRKQYPALLLTDCCDVMRRVFDVLQQEAQIEFIHLLFLPHLRGENDCRLFAAGLQEMIREWGLYFGRAFDARGLLKAWAENAGLKRQELEKLQAGAHLTLKGAHAGKMIRQMIEERITPCVDDQTCTGMRILSIPPGWQETLDHDGEIDEDALLLDYAKALLGQERSCMRMQKRQEAPVGELSRGVVFHTVKFCDYYSFEYRDLQRSVRVPLLKIESDLTPQGSGQLLTRVEAFGELLAQKGEDMPGKNGAKASAAGADSQSKGPVAGIDSGSATTNAVIMDRDGKILGWSILPTGKGAAAQAGAALEKALLAAGLKKEDLSRIVTTGYGREHIEPDRKSVTEITCHAKGAHFLDADIDTVIDIGGQDSKVIRIDENGNVVSFAMNDKCAAGTGRFLEMMADTLGMTLEEMSRSKPSSDSQVQISSMCSVFAQSEVVSLVADNTDPAAIIQALNRAVASRTAALLLRLGRQDNKEHRCMMTGGVALNSGVQKALEEKLGTSLVISEHAQICGAIGAALIALGK